VNPVEWMSFLASIADPLFRLYQLVRISRAADIEAEEQAKQIALDLVRAAKDAQARKEIQG
jgi:hypothetical protein